MLLFVLVSKLLLVFKGLFERSVERSAFWTFLSKMSTGDEGPPKGLWKLKFGFRLLLLLEMLLEMLMLLDVELLELMLMPPVKFLFKGEVQACLDAGAGAEEEDEEGETTDSLLMLEGNFLPGWFLCWRWMSLGKDLFNVEKLLLPVLALAFAVVVFADGGGEEASAVSDSSGSYSGSFLDIADDVLAILWPVADGMSDDDL